MGIHIHNLTNPVKGSDLIHNNVFDRNNKELIIKLKWLLSKICTFKMTVNK